LLTYPVEKAADVGAASDKGWANWPRESRPEASYVLLCVPQFNVPPNSLVAFTISEADSAEKIAARVYPQMVAGGTLHVIPLMEVPIGGGAKMEKKYRG
jgi:hypothetical protein